MKNIYVIMILCDDTNGKYIDYVNRAYDNFNTAKLTMIKCAKDEVNSLNQESNEFKLEEDNNIIKVIKKNTNFVLSKYEVIELKI